MSESTNCWCPCHKGEKQEDACCYCKLPEVKYKKLLEFVKEVANDEGQRGIIEEIEIAKKLLKEIGESNGKD